jgi:hypothetical protein
MQAFGISVSRVALAFNDPEGVPVAPVNPEGRPYELAEEFSGPGIQGESVSNLDRKMLIRISG